MVSILELLVKLFYKGVYLPDREPYIKAFPANRFSHIHLLLAVVNIELTPNMDMSSTLLILD